MLEKLLQASDFLSLQNQWVVALYVFFGTILLLALKSWYSNRKLEKLLKEENQIGG